MVLFFHPCTISWEGLGAGGERDDRRWDGWMASLTRWMWIWVNSRSWWWTGRPGMLWFMGHKESDTTEWLNWTELNWILLLVTISTGSFLCKSALPRWMCLLKNWFLKTICLSVPAHLTASLFSSELMLRHTIWLEGAVSRAVSCFHRSTKAEAYALSALV